MWSWPTLTLVADTRFDYSAHPPPHQGNTNLPSRFSFEVDFQNQLTYPNPYHIRQPKKSHLLRSVERRVEGGTLAVHVFSRRLVHLRHGHRFRRAERRAQGVNNVLNAVVFGNPAELQHTRASVLVFTRKSEVASAV